jgi:hypothetical protein
MREGETRRTCSTYGREEDSNRFLVGRRRMKETTRKTTCRRENNLEMDLRDWIAAVQDRDH